MRCTPQQIGEANVSTAAPGRLPAAIAQALAPWAPAQSSVQEDAAIRADLAYNDLKNTGELRRREDARALDAQIQAGVQ